MERGTIYFYRKGFLGEKACFLIQMKLTCEAFLHTVT